MVSLQNGSRVGYIVEPISAIIASPLLLLFRFEIGLSTNIAFFLLELPLTLDDDFEEDLDDDLVKLLLFIIKDDDAIIALPP